MSDYSNEIEAMLIKTLQTNPKDASANGLVMMGQALLLKTKFRNVFADVRAFQNKMNQPKVKSGDLLPTKLQQFRDGLLREERREYAEAVLNKDLVKQLDALIDMMYVIVGTIATHNWDGEEAWHRVHQANMKKEPSWEKGRQLAVDLGQVDVIKPEGWEPPDLSDLVV